MSSIKNRPSWGFTMIEAMCAIALLGLIAPLLIHVYSAAFQNLESSTEKTLIDSQLRSRMDTLLSLRFDQLTSGFEAVMIESEALPVTWSVANVDLDGDTVPDPSAKRITVTIKGYSLVTLVVNTGKMVGQI